ncbi:hypothetical protein GGR53DRAFT_504963 [Hypoxylon sp. FL1150]|nr:hypothetical protein GGR53DRAFT_504963 [Hypoxylon sp. FL1150]
MLYAFTMQFYPLFFFCLCLCRPGSRSRDSGLVIFAAIELSRSISILVSLPTSTMYEVCSGNIPTPLGDTGCKPLRSADTVQNGSE